MKKILRCGPEKQLNCDPLLFTKLSNFNNFSSCGSFLIRKKQPWFKKISKHQTKHNIFQRKKKTLGEVARVGTLGGHQVEEKNIFKCTMEFNWNPWIAIGQSREQAERREESSRTSLCFFTHVLMSVTMKSFMLWPCGIGMSLKPSECWCY